MERKNKKIILIYIVAFVVLGLLNSLIEGKFGIDTHFQFLFFVVVAIHFAITLSRSDISKNIRMIGYAFVLITLINLGVREFYGAVRFLEIIWILSIAGVILFVIIRKFINRRKEGKEMVEVIKDGSD